MDSPNSPRRVPLVVAVLGLKDSGKTTVCEALIGELRSRGRRVAAVKSSHLDSLDRGRPGSDSERLARAGADYVAARAHGETLEWHARRLGPEELTGRVPAGTDVLLSEGGEPEFAAGAAVVCLVRASAYAETVAVRRVPKDRIIALSGRFAAAGAHRTAARSEAVEAPGPEAHEDAATAPEDRANAREDAATAPEDRLPLVPVLDPRVPRDLARLADLILARLSPD